MTTFHFARLPDGRIRTTIESDMGVVRRVIEAVTDLAAERPTRLAARRADLATIDGPVGDDVACDCEGPEAGDDR